VKIRHSKGLSRMKTAIVTGASRGIGKTIALKLTALNYAMVLVGRNKQHVSELKAEIEKMGMLCLEVLLLTVLFS
jgi:short-subunit dehydrogenase